MKNILIVVLAFALFSCTQKNIKISNLSGTQVGNYAADELSSNLNNMYSNMAFESAGENSEAAIIFLLNEQANKVGLDNLPTRKESFKIIQKEEKIYIVSPDERGLLNAAYALLDKQGCGFYISGDVIPEKEWKGFEGWEMEDEPLTGDRFLFNWHNFLSGCTGWNLEDWQIWIDQANKMRYNGIMVHAYGNNPMFSFEYLGEKKKTGYLNNTASGRDWGNQHVNDVRRLVGGEIFDVPVYGAEASMATEENKEKEATELMQQVFQYAEDRGTKVIFALDFDTWMANPENIVRKLPEEAILKVDGRVTPNPEHPEGFKYYRQVLKSLLEMYPQIDQLSVWHRRPGSQWNSGTIWMKFPYEKFPENWKKEYKQKLNEHSEIEDNLAATSMFAYAKVVIALQKARDEIRPDLEITEGSWRFEYVPYADAFFPKDVPLLPLDWEVVFDTSESIEILSKAAQNRDVYPIIWAHHDDHRYIGRPYTPWDNLSDRLSEINAGGFGIIHWTTHPLDLYFTSSGRQVWKNSKNESVSSTVANFVNTKFGENELLTAYYYTWLTEGPMFGRETSDHFVDLGRQSLGHKMESWDEMKTKAQERLTLLSEIDMENDNLHYQRAMEEFYSSFFQNQQFFVEAFDLAQDGEIEKAIERIQKTNPDESIQKYADAAKTIGFTSGEKALVFSMNTRWKADFINLRQGLGLEPVRFKFSPTQHDPLAQSPGRFTYFIDEEKNWWRCLWEHELENEDFIEAESKTFLEIKDDFIFELRSIHGQPLPPGEYELKLKFLNAENNFQAAIEEEGKVIQSGTQKNLSFTKKGQTLKLSIVAKGEPVRLNGIIIQPK